MQCRVQKLSALRGGKGSLRRLPVLGSKARYRERLEWALRLKCENACATRHSSRLQRNTAEILDGFDALRMC
jgi:hypothetical protein